MLRFRQQGVGHLALDKADRPDWGSTPGGGEKMTGGLLTVLTYFRLLLPFRTYEVPMFYCECPYRWKIVPLIYSDFGDRQQVHLSLFCVPIDAAVRKLSNIVVPCCRAAPGDGVPPGDRGHPALHAGPPQPADAAIFGHHARGRPQNRAAGAQGEVRVHRLRGRRGEHAPARAAAVRGVHARAAGAAGLRGVLCFLFLFVFFCVC